MVIYGFTSIDLPCQMFLLPLKDQTGVVCMYEGLPLIVSAFIFIALGNHLKRHCLSFMKKDIVFTMDITIKLLQNRVEI
jgi:hypothetical protein